MVCILNISRLLLPPVVSSAGKHLESLLVDCSRTQRVTKGLARNSMHILYQHAKEQYNGERQMFQVPKYKPGILKAGF